ncbi:MAG: UMP kinase [Candidatus Eisenbacteria bacterium]|nr:UMP kinase [Candidatus Eisenbacteria bacterium]
MAAAYRRVILKVSGEALSGDGRPISPEAVLRLASEVKAAVDLGVEVGLVVGGGNIVRGVTVAGGADARVAADHMGMVATILNALALRAAFASLGVRASVMSAVPCGPLADPYDHRRAGALLSEGAVVVFAAGTGNPFFSTDSAAALRAAELGADALLKATKVDGVYDSDPVKNPSARRFETLTHLDVIKGGLAVMDLTAVSLCRQQKLPIVVFALSTPGNVARAVRGETIGTRVMEE